MTTDRELAGMLLLENAAVAGRLRRIADGLERPDGNPHRVRAYRTAADTVERLDRSVAEVIGEGGRSALEQLPGVGKRLSQVIEQLTLTGDSPKLADQVRGVREALAGRFRRPIGGPQAEPPPVADVLAIDAAYRERSSTGVLRQVAPRRFNPTAAAWLPVWKSRKGGQSYRAVFSNTPTAHRLNKVRDWVVLYFGKDGASGQCTVLTDTSGPLTGRRVVRGREMECARYYDKADGLFAA